jgi:hypothetical protein
MIFIQILVTKIIPNWVFMFFIPVSNILSQGIIYLKVLPAIVNRNTYPIWLTCNNLMYCCTSFGVQISVSTYGRNFYFSHATVCQSLNLVCSYNIQQLIKIVIFSISCDKRRYSFNNSCGNMPVKHCWCLKTIIANVMNSIIEISTM